MIIPRILLTAGASGSGKTTITCGLLQALVNRGLSVCSFKCGPDYIDPMFHKKVIGTPSCNLDTFFAGPDITRHLLCTHAEGRELCVMEGVMGYYDGVGGTTTRASAYDLADVTDTPAVLIVNSRGMSVSLAAFVKGFLTYRENSHIRGVIFNQMSPMLYPRIRELVERETGVRCFGYVPVLKDCVLESRHLGLVLPDEVAELRDQLQKLSVTLEESLDIDGLIFLAQEAPEIKEGFDPASVNPDFAYQAAKPLRIGVADDEAFCFFYEDNLRLLTRMGAELVRFSPVHDEQLPENLDGLLFVGGYPELYAWELSRNTAMRTAVKKAIEGKMPVMAECGGFMYLHEFMEDTVGKSHEMAGVVEGSVHHTHKLSRFGYVNLSSREDCTAFGKHFAGPVPAHEFHYFDSTNCGDAFHAAKPESSRGWDCIIGNETMMAGYPHLYYYGAPEVPRAFLEACERYHDTRG